jgi:hypothetical protein
MQDKISNKEVKENSYFGPHLAETIVEIKV